MSHRIKTDEELEPEDCHNCENPLFVGDFAYRVYFLGVNSHSQEDILASNHWDAITTISSRYGLAHSITAVRLW